MSLARTKNLRHEEYVYFSKIKAYAIRKKHLHMDLSAIKKDKLICASVVFVKNMTWENLWVVMRMIFEKGRVVKNALIVLKSIILKYYYIYVLKEDRPINI